VTTQSKVIGVAKNDGTIAFSKSLPGGLAGAPGVTEDHILVPRDTFGEGFDSNIEIESPKLYALDRETNRTTWTVTLDAKYLASVAVADDIYAQTDREIYRIRPDGTIRWRYTFEDSFDWREMLSYLRPVISPDGIYVGHRDSLVKLDRASGEIVWTRSIGKTVFPPVVLNESVVVSSTDHETVGLTRSEGDIRWRETLPPVWAPASTENTAVISTEGKLLGVEAETGEQRWTVEMSLSTCPPVIGGDTVFAAPGGMDLVAVDVNSGNRIDSRATDTMVESITPDSTGLLTRQSGTEGPILRQYPLK
jgi:outer membrane protein assembly factor BamB